MFPRCTRRHMTRPLCIDLFCGLGGWAEGFLAEGWDVVGFDIERHDYGTGGYPGQLVIQDVLTLHGSQFRNADMIVASPPCQGYSYRAMPWKRAKALPPPDNTLFEACFRIQRQANNCAACDGTGNFYGHDVDGDFLPCDECNGTGYPGGQHRTDIPLIVENVKGAQPWVGRAKWHYGSYYLWGDLPALMPVSRSLAKIPGQDWNRFKQLGEVSRHWNIEALKSSGGTWFGESHGKKFAQAAQNGVRRRSDGVKQQGSGRIWFDEGIAKLPSNSLRRKAASAQIAKIPFAFAQYIARVFKPVLEIAC